MIINQDEEIFCDGVIEAESGEIWSLNSIGDDQSRHCPGDDDLGELI